MHYLLARNMSQSVVHIFILKSIIELLHIFIKIDPIKKKTTTENGGSFFLRSKASKATVK